MSWADFYIIPTGNDLNAGSTNADNAVYTSTAGNWDGTSVFTPTDGQTTNSLVAPGDYCAIYATGGTKTGYVAQVVTVASGVNGIITLSTTIKYGSVPTSNSGSRVCKAGGSWATLSGPATSGGPLNPTANAPQSTRINIKASTYTHTTASTVVGLNGTLVIGVWYRGFNSSPGDMDAINTGVAGTTIPSLTWTTGTLAVGAHTRFSNISFTGAPSADLISGNQGCKYYRCRIIQTSSNSAARAADAGTAGTSTGAVWVACYLEVPSTASQCFGARSSMRLYGCIFNGATSGIAVNTQTSCIIKNCIFYNQGGDSLLLTTSTGNIIDSCSFYSPIGNGISITGAGDAIVTNCYFENVNQASKAAINNSSGTSTSNILAIGNAYYNCTTNRVGITEDFTIFDNGTLGSAGFVAPGGQNFSMGAVGQNIAFPGLFENTSVFQGYLDVGAVHHQASASSAGTSPQGPPYPTLAASPTQQVKSGLM